MGPYDFIDDFQFKNLEKSVFDSTKNDNELINDLLKKKQDLSLIEKEKYPNIFGSEQKNENTQSSNIFDTISNSMSSSNKNAGEVSENGEGGFMNDILGEQGENEAENIMAFGSDILKTASDDSYSDTGMVMNTANLTFKGAKAGMSVGGPVGAAVGAIGGLTYGLVDGIGNMKKMNEEKRKDYNKNLEKKKTIREQEYLMSQGEQSIAKLKALRESQLNYISDNLY